jgi:hypothetical protein
MVQISPSDGSNLVVSWGSWPPIGQKGNQNVFIHDSFGKHVDISYSKYKSELFLHLWTFKTPIFITFIKIYSLYKK